MTTKGKVMVWAAGLFFLSTAVPAFAETVDGMVMEVNVMRQTFQICPAEQGCGGVVKNIFMVRPDTKWRGFVNLRDLDIGDRIIVEGKPLNKAVWKAASVARRQ